MVGRIPITDVTPVLEHARYPAKATTNEPFEVTAVVFREGHDKYAAEVLFTDPLGRIRPPVRMSDARTTVSRLHASITPDLPGAWHFSIQSWSDPISTWLHNADIKVRAGVDVELMLLEGALLLGRVDLSEMATADQLTVKDAIAALKDEERPALVRLAAAESPQLQAVLAQHPIRDLLTMEGPYPFFVDRDRAVHSSWYEFFPRSEGAVVEADGSITSGNFTTSAKRLDAIAEMGFNVVYLPPIHPIGEQNRKGPNNTLTAGPDDPGSPWAIGSHLGGHDAIHPDLGSIADFDRFVARAKTLGLEVALDFALQAAPDHPWVSEHPEWFTTLADGSIAYAENPPKKYQDIYPLNFDNDPKGLYDECERIVRFWMSHGVRIFRVDNPHTKPLPFWEWLLGRIRATDPDVLFLAEAFTLPPMMHALGMIGFHQSYTYFTWRTEKREIEDYLQEVSHESSVLMRPNFFVNTPDILHASLQYGGPPMFRIRAALAATSSPSWGVYSGYELYERVPVQQGSEEYLDSEKYQIRVRDWDAAAASGETLAPYLTMLNRIREQHPALQQLHNLQLHRTDDDAVIAYSKTAGDDTVIVVINLDPFTPRTTTVHLDLSTLGLEPGATFTVHDEVTGAVWRWGEHNYVRLDPFFEPAHIVTLRHS
jgi:starch synthase (maltosyl-transferring)